jgi:drug/metabolite transporter (DMT)-like permease
MTRRPQWGIDALLVLMVVIWGANYSVIKRCFAEIPPQPFNALRLTIASTTFYAGIRQARRRARASNGRLSSVFYTASPLTTRDRIDLLWLGLVGHLAYQTCFAAGVNATSVSNAALIIGATPVAVATASALMGRERIGPLHWIGIAVSALGIYVVVGRGASFGGATWHGDLLVMISVVCWTAYTLGAARLIAHHSPLYVTGTTMIIGAVPYVIVALPQILQIDVAHVSAWTWAALLLSAWLALDLAYLIYYTGIQRLGPARTSVYSNMIPIVAMTIAALWLHEPVTAAKAIGAAAVLTGLFLTRLGKSQATRVSEKITTLRG